MQVATDLSSVPGGAAARAGHAGAEARDAAVGVVRRQVERVAATLVAVWALHVSLRQIKERSRR